MVAFLCTPHLLWLVCRAFFNVLVSYFSPEDHKVRFQTLRKSNLQTNVSDNFFKLPNEIIFKIISLKCTWIVTSYKICTCSPWRQLVWPTVWLHDLWVNEVLQIQYSKRGCPVPVQGVHEGYFELIFSTASPAFPPG